MDRQQVIKTAKKRLFDDSELPSGLPHPKYSRAEGLSGTQYDLRVLKRKSYLGEGPEPPEDPEDPDFSPPSDVEGGEDPDEYVIPTEEEEEEVCNDTNIAQKKRAEEGQAQCYYCDNLFKYPRESLEIRIRRCDTGNHYSENITEMKKEIKLRGQSCNSDDYEDLIDNFASYLQDMIYMCPHHMSPYYIPPCCMACLIEVGSASLECPCCVGCQRQ